MRKEILSLSENSLALKSHDFICVSSDEITLKEHRDLGFVSHIISGNQYLPSTSTAPPVDADNVKSG